jgi:hypothetical protein
MKKVCLILLTCLLLSSLQPAKAILKFESKEINFGKIDEGKSINLVFKFTNAGDSILLIQNVRPSCGCTVTQLKKRKYDPGEKGTIPVKFVSKGFGGRKVMKTIRVTSNDRKAPTILLKINGMVTLKDFARFEISSANIDFKRISKGRQKSKKLIIKNTGNLDLKILEVTHVPEIIPLFSDSMIKPNQSSVLEVVFKPKTEGKFSYFLKIRTNDHRQYYKLIKIQGQVTK